MEDNSPFSTITFTIGGSTAPQPNGSASPPPSNGRSSGSPASAPPSLHVGGGRGRGSPPPRSNGRSSGSPASAPPSLHVGGGGRGSPPPRSNDRSSGSPPSAPQSLHVGGSGRGSPPPSNGRSSGSPASAPPSLHVGGGGGGRGSPPRLPHRRIGVSESSNKYTQSAHKKLCLMFKQIQSYMKTINRDIIPISLRLFVENLEKFFIHPEPPSELTQLDVDWQKSICLNRETFAVIFDLSNISARIIRMFEDFHLASITAQFHRMSFIWGSSVSRSYESKIEMFGQQNAEYVMNLFFRPKEMPEGYLDVDLAIILQILTCLLSALASEVRLTDFHLYVGTNDGKENDGGLPSIMGAILCALECGVNVVLLCTTPNHSYVDVARDHSNFKILIVDPQTSAPNMSGAADNIFGNIDVQQQIRNQCPLTQQTFRQSSVDPCPVSQSPMVHVSVDQEHVGQVPVDPCPVSQSPMGHVPVVERSNYVHVPIVHVPMVHVPVVERSNYVHVQMVPVAQVPINRSYIPMVHVPQFDLAEIFPRLYQ